MTENFEYDVIAGTPDQVEVFMDLQRMLVKLYNMWPEDTALAVYAAAAGSVVALIETQYRLHVKECDNCKDEKRPPTIDLVSVVRSNFDLYYERGSPEMNHAQASEFIHKYTKGRAH
jgi:hypothetical protein